MKNVIQIEQEIRTKLDPLFMETLVEAKNKFVKGIKEYLESVNESDRESIKELLISDFSFEFLYGISFDEIIDDLGLREES